MTWSERTYANAPFRAWAYLNQLGDFPLSFCFRRGQGGCNVVVLEASTGLRWGRSRFGSVRRCGSIRTRKIKGDVLWIKELTYIALGICRVSAARTVSISAFRSSLLQDASVRKFDTRRVSWEKKYRPVQGFLYHGRLLGSVKRGETKDGWVDRNTYWVCFDFLGGMLDEKRVNWRYAMDHCRSNMQQRRHGPRQ